jgi:hypothetical protein
LVHPAQAFLNSTPQLLARERRAVAQGSQLGPGDFRMDATAHAAVGASNDVFLADDFSYRITLISSPKIRPFGLGVYSIFFEMPCRI